LGGTLRGFHFGVPFGSGHSGRTLGTFIWTDFRGVHFDRPWGRGFESSSTDLGAVQCEDPLDATLDGIGAHIWMPSGC
jgi:hypothetical protein